MGNSSGLAASWPRQLIAEGRAQRLADWWAESCREAVLQDQPAFSRAGLSPRLKDALFDVWRARQMVRGLEGAEAALVSQDAGLRRASATQTLPGVVRISRLLLVSADGSSRFYRQAEALRSRFEQRLEILLIDCDQEILGSALFGPGRRARALLLDHKVAVIRILTILDEELAGGSGAQDLA